jgi:hypothetical protein
MTKMQKRIATAIATGSLLLQSSPLVFASTSFIISGNGSDSDSDVVYTQTNSTIVVQNNQLEVNNDVDVNSNTGGNSAQDNTGGEVSINTGDSDAFVKLVNSGNSNVADVENCGSCAGDTSVLISGNGSDTENEVELNKLTTTNVFQNNYAKIDNDVDVDLETGNNEAEDNTGGDAVIVTGDADATVKVFNTVNANSAIIGGSEEGGDVDLIISGNGSESDNDIVLGLSSYALLTQNNNTDIDNDVDVDADTGENSVEDNTGGFAAIGTGNADVSVFVDNVAGFNTASVEDCCVGGVFGKVDGNGSDSENEIEAYLDSALELFQDNSCGGYDLWQLPGFFDEGGWRDHSRPCFDNDVDVEAQTGDNEVEDSTAESEDPLILTGDSDTNVVVQNTGSSNAYGQSAPAMDWENMMGMNFDLSFSFDMSDFLAWWNSQN